MASTAKEINGEPHLIATMTAKPGKADQTAMLLKNIQVNAKGDNEPGCFRYDVLNYGDHFCVVELYKDAAAVDLHNAASDFQAFVKEAENLLVSGTLSIKFYKEV